MAQATLDTAFYESIGASYETAFAHDAGLLSFLQRLLQHLPPSSHVLDAGCGTGKPVAFTLAAAGHKVTGIDIAPAMVALSRTAVPNGDFSVADMREWQPSPEAPLDAALNILSLFLLSRTEIEAQVLKWASWLRPGGVLAVCSLGAEDMDVTSRGVKFDDDGKCVQQLPVRFMGRDPPVTLFTKAGWRDMLAAAGFEVVDECTDMFVPPEESLTDPEPHYFVIARRV